MRRLLHDCSGQTETSKQQRPLVALLNSRKWFCWSTNYLQSARGSGGPIAFTIKRSPWAGKLNVIVYTGVVAYEYESLLFTQWISRLLATHQLTHYVNCLPQALAEKLTSWVRPLSIAQLLYFPLTSKVKHANKLIRKRSAMMPRSDDPSAARVRKVCLPVFSSHGYDCVVCFKSAQALNIILHQFWLNR